MQTVHGVKIVSVQYCKDIFAHYPPDVLKKVINGQKPDTVEVAFMGDKRNILYTHPIMESHDLPRFSSIGNLVDWLDKIAVEDKPVTNHSTVGYFFMTDNNKYFA